ncbi:MAG: TetR family transcriptional regulator C-terminal domain-containing protein [Parvibaculaceae bacterium]
MALCLEEAKQQGSVPAGCDVRRMANLLVDCWEGVALRSRLRRNPAPLTTMLDFYLHSIAVPNVPQPRRRRVAPGRRA